MPEYLALVHHRNISQNDGEDAAPPTVEELESAFMRMERMGVAKVH